MPAGRGSSSSTLEILETSPSVSAQSLFPFIQHVQGNTHTGVFKGGCLQLCSSRIDSSNQTSSRVSHDVTQADRKKLIRTPHDVVGAGKGSIKHRASENCPSGCQQREISRDTLCSRFIMWSTARPTHFSVVMNACISMCTMKQVVGCMWLMIHVLCKVQCVEYREMERVNVPWRERDLQMNFRKVNKVWQNGCF